MNIPNDPIMLLSFVNLKLRDYYSNLDSMCNDLNISKEQLISKLKNINYIYDSKLNQFV